MEDFDIQAAVTEVGNGLGLELDASTDTNGSGDDDLGAAGSDLDSPAAASDGEAAPRVGGDGADAEGKPGEGTPAVDAAAAGAVAADPLKDPPKTWRKEAAAVWAALPPEARQEIVKREEDIFRGIENYKADAGFGKSVKASMAPFLPIMEQYGIDPAAQVQQLMQAHHTLALGTPEQKRALFQKLAQDYQIDLTEVILPNEAPYTDPAVKALQTELQGVKSQLSAAERVKAEEARQSLEKQIEVFAADPKNVHFSELASDMAVLLEKGVCRTLEEAYERALWMNPVVRSKELTRQQTEKARKEVEEAAKRAAKARQSTAANVRTSAKSGSAAAPLGSIDDTLNETLRAIQTRAS